MLKLRPEKVKIYDNSHRKLDELNINELVRLNANINYTAQST